MIQCGLGTQVTRNAVATASGTSISSGMGQKTVGYALTMRVNMKVSTRIMDTVVMNLKKGCEYDVGRNLSRTIIRRIIWKKAKGRCAHCGRYTSSKYQTVDHYVPQSKGGTWDQRNLLPACVSCNKTRGNRDVNPKEYYKYAEKWAIEEAVKYEKEFNYKYKRMKERP